MASILKSGLPVALCSDHAGWATKQAVIAYLDKEGIPYKDFGTYNEESCDYPDFAHKAAAAVANGECDRGVVVCTTGIGVSIVANRHKGVRCALCSNTDQAKFTRLHNDANIIAFGQKYTTFDMAKLMLDVFLTTDYEGGRHARRVAKIEDVED